MCLELDQGLISYQRLLLWSPLQMFILSTGFFVGRMPATRVIAETRRQPSIRMLPLVQSLMEPKAKNKYVLCSKTRSKKST